MSVDPRRRRSEDGVWMDVARAVADRSKSRKGVGAVILGQDGRILATGYNGPPAFYGPAKDKESAEDFCPREMHGAEKDPSYDDCVCIHAEINALLFSDFSLRAFGTMYVTSVPCMMFAKAIGNSGLSRLVFNETDLYIRPHRDPMAAIRFLVDCGIQVKGLRL